MPIRFNLSRLPRVVFGAGSLMSLPDLVRRFGDSVLVVTGARSFVEGPHWQVLVRHFEEANLDWRLFHVEGEPSPGLVDEAVRELRSAGFAVVVGIGGGSALDAAKAIAGLLKPGNSVMDHLEGVGPELPYIGPATPYIAVPTTAGTGSEATKNAVLSRHGDHAFKKSFRDESLMAEYAVVDPDLLASCPPCVIAANGMDAFTQLLESYVSLNANVLTDSLAVSGMEAVRDSLLPWFEGQSEAGWHRERMAYGALLSGITLAQVGLGSVHGVAAPLGAFFPVPHGVACGALVAEATRINIAALKARLPDSPALRKYAAAGRLLAGETLSDEVAQERLVAILDEWTMRLRIPRLGKYGIGAADIPTLVANSRGSSMKTNPVVLDDEELSCLIRARL